MPGITLSSLPTFSFDPQEKAPPVSVIILFVQPWKGVWAQRSQASSPERHSRDVVGPLYKSRPACFPPFFQSIRPLVCVAHIWTIPFNFHNPRKLFYKRKTTEEARRGRGICSRSHREKVMENTVRGLGKDERGSLWVLPSSPSLDPHRAPTKASPSPSQPPAPSPLGPQALRPPGPFNRAAEGAAGGGGGAQWAARSVTSRRPEAAASVEGWGRPAGAGRPAEALAAGWDPRGAAAHLACRAPTPGGSGGGGTMPFDFRR